MLDIHAEALQSSLTTCQQSLSNSSPVKSHDAMTVVNKITILLDDGLNSSHPEIHPYDKQCLKDFQEVFNTLSMQYNFKVEYWDNHNTLLKDLQNAKPDYIINLVNYGFKRKEKNNYFSSIFEMINIPFMNAGMSGITLTDDKNLLYYLAQTVNVPCANQIVLKDTDILAYKELPIEFSFPAFLKLRNGRGSCGVTSHSFIQNTQELYEKFPMILKEYRTHSELGLNNWILQEYLPGAEFNVAVIGNGDDITVFPIMELNFNSIGENVAFQTYQVKADILDSMKDPAVQGRLSSELNDKIQNYACKLFKILECRDYCRMEFRLDKEGIPKIIDVNPLTSYGKDECFAVAARNQGFNYLKLWETLLLTSFKRQRLVFRKG